MSYGVDAAGNRGVVVTEAGSHLGLINSCITQLKAQGPSRTCGESKEEEDPRGLEMKELRSRCSSTGGLMHQTRPGRDACASVASHI